MFPNVNLMFMVLGVTITIAADFAYGSEPTRQVDFNRDIRPILSNRCYACHGPDDAKIEAGLRLDNLAAASKPSDSGATAIVPGSPESSELLRRVMSRDLDDRMPPPRMGEGLSSLEIDLLKRWIEQGANYAQHWSLSPPSRPILPNEDPSHANWSNNAIDRFALAKMIEKNFQPSPEADRGSQLRRLSLDLIGLPPSPDELDAFLNDDSPEAYESQVERLLASPAFGEHWARKWLDLARYADSAGYADDPARTIWAYRDWVIQAINSNMPFDQFTLEQLAGDMLEDPTQDNLIATAFHRNTLTNNEGGTNDEEFRNVAVVDRVNTTMAVWMGVTMACAQCHNHKFDPITQADYFRVFAIFNQSEDADRGNESPYVEVMTAEQARQRRAYEIEKEQLLAKLKQVSPELLAEHKTWLATLAKDAIWDNLVFSDGVTSSGAPVVPLAEGRIQTKTETDTDSVTVNLGLATDFKLKDLQAIRISTIPDASSSHGGASAANGNGNFVLTNVQAELRLKDNPSPEGRYVRIDLPGSTKILSLAEVQVFSGSENLALEGTAEQSSTDYEGPASRAIDGNTDGQYQKNSTTHTAQSDNPWWEVDLKKNAPIDKIVVFNRTDNGVFDRLSGAVIQILNEQKQPIWKSTIAKSKLEPESFQTQLAVPVQFSKAVADYNQDQFPASATFDNDPLSGWAVGGAISSPHAIQLLIKPLTDEQIGLLRSAGDEAASNVVLRLILDCKSQHPKHVLANFRIDVSADHQASRLAEVPSKLIQLAREDANLLSKQESSELVAFYLEKIAPSLNPVRSRLQEVDAALASNKPATTVPVMRDLAKDKQRETRIQLRGNYRVHGEAVQPGFPSAFHPARKADAPVTRLALAEWLMQENNPLTARVLVNRYWETLFGSGLVRTSEEFGSQGELPTHPELLDWLATEAIRLNWDTKAILRLMVTSSTYRQQSSMDTKRLEADPENYFLARGPRFRLTAEQVRDQSLAVAGLLSHKMFGEPVKPPQPKMGLSAAFGSGTDWETSAGDNRYRRGLYTTWRRSNPYPSMATFDAPNREVCTLRRDRTNTPLQALVTLNDPVYVEAAQALARKVLLLDKPNANFAERVNHAFRLTVTRSARQNEIDAIQRLYDKSHAALAADPQSAMKLATEPLGPLPAGADPIELAAWTAIANVLLNLDEVLTTR
jgi:Protein of unknown function (DUF1553)/Protein of unknown function (DUF1549)/Planctomycete cytochrome C/F5/8 type C domain